MYTGLAMDRSYLLIAPPLLGLIAEHFGIRVSFGIGIPLVIISWFAVHALKPASD